MSIEDKLTELNNKVTMVYYAGKNAYHRQFMEDYQNETPQIFRGCGWCEKTFYPVKDIVADYGGTFTLFNWPNGSFDFAQRLEECGVRLIIGNNVSVASAIFDNARVSRVPELDFSHLSNISMSRMFHSSYNLVTVDKIVLPHGVTTFADAFFSCNSLENILFEGEIPVTINFQYSPLSIVSIRNIIEHLKNIVGTTQRATLTLKLAAAANMSDEDRQNITDKGWTLSEI